MPGDTRPITYQLTAVDDHEIPGNSLVAIT
jgi:hypothetical protein